MTWAVSAELDAFDEAIAWLLERVPLTAKQFAALEKKARVRALRIAAAAQADVALQVWRALARSIEQGTPFDEFKRTVSSALTSAWGEPDSPRVETIHRNAVQTAYNRGRVEQMSHPAVAKARPFWMLDAILDQRTSPICNSLDGTILPADDPFWNSHVPPLHHRCRSSLRSLRRTDAERRGVSKVRPNVAPDDGFGSRDGEWKPDRSKYPKGLKP